MTNPRSPRWIVLLALLLAAAPLRAAGPVAERPGTEAPAVAGPAAPVAPAAAFPGWETMDEAQRSAAVTAQIDAWSQPGAVDEIAPQELGAEIAKMEAVEASMGRYAGDKLEALQAARRQATERRGAIRAERLARGADGWARSVSSTLERHGTTKSGAATFVALTAHAGAQQPTTEKGRLQAAQALGAHLTSSYGLDHSRNVVDGLLQVGLAAQSEPPRRAVVEALSRDLLGAVSPVAARDPERELAALTAVAHASSDPETRALATSALMQLGGMSDSSYRSFGRRFVDFFTQPRRPRGFDAAARAALGQVTVGGVRVRAEAAPNDAWKPSGLRRAASWSKWRTRIVGAAITISALGLIGPLGFVAAGAALALGLLVFLQGLSHHRGVWGIVQALSLVGGAFATASALAVSTGPLGWAGLGLTVAYASVMAGVAVWSFKTQRPWVGLLLNAFLLGLF